MKVYTFHNIEYYLSDDVYSEEPDSFIGCSKTTRLIVEKKHLKNNEYIFMKYIRSSSEWVISEEKYKLAKLFITKEWVHNNLIKYKPEKTDEDLKIESMKAPEILLLNDDEKFKDINGNILDIEVRGTRDMNNIYFKVKDVSDKFKLGDVKTILLNKESSFEHSIHYKNFKIKEIIINDSITNKKGNNKYLFLTFVGLTKLLYVSRSKNAEHFQQWANNILFIHKLGTKEAKKKLSKNLLGCEIDESRKVIKCNSGDVSCIYLTTLGYVKNLRNTFNIPDEINDNMIVVKYGRTDDLYRRLKEHDNTYGKLDNVKVLLKTYSYVDTEYVSKAEKNIKHYMKACKYTFKPIINSDVEYKELAIISLDNFDGIIEQYELVKNNYGGNCKELIHKLDNIDNQYKIKLLEKDNLLLEKENEINKIKIELLQLKLKLAEQTC
jgi:hypothetical protein